MNNGSFLCFPGQIDQLSREKERNEEALHSLRQRLRCSQNMISKLEEKLASCEAANRDIEESKTLIEAQSKKQALKCANLNQALAEIQTTLSESISKENHQRIITENQESLNKKDLIIESLNDQIATLMSRLEQSDQNLLETKQSLSTSISTVTLFETAATESRIEIESLNLQLREAKKNLAIQTEQHRERIRSLEHHHSLAISMLEKSHSVQFNRLQSELDLSSKLVLLKNIQVDQMKCKLVDYEIQLVDQQIRDICIDLGVQSDSLLLIPQSSQTDRRVLLDNVATETDHIHTLTEDQVSVIRRHLSCSSCTNTSSTTARPVSTLFPCGHGMCSDCVTLVMQSDLNRVGIACKQCDNNLPVTRISLNYPMIALSDYLSSVLPVRDC